MLHKIQIAALRYLIYASKDGTDLTKRVMWFLMEKSTLFEHEVCLTLTAQPETRGYSGEEIEKAATGFHDMLSGLGTTHINEILTAMRAPIYFSYHHGDFDLDGKDDPETEGQCDSGKTPLQYTFWLSRKRYSRSANLATTTREELDGIDLRRPGLYPILEPM